MGYLVYIDGIPVTTVVSALTLDADSSSLAVYAHDYIDGLPQLGG